MPPAQQRSSTDAVAPALEQRPQFYRIDFDMMLKGSIYHRRKQTVRQFGVTVNGATKLVTSGDMVDAATYDALVAAGAIRPVEETGASVDENKQTKPVNQQDDEE